VSCSIRGGVETKMSVDGRFLKQAISGKLGPMLVRPKKMSYAGFSHPDFIASRSSESWIGPTRVSYRKGSVPNEVSPAGFRVSKDRLVS